MKKIILTCGLLFLSHIPICAQWTVDASFGINKGIRSIDHLYADTYSRESGIGCSLDLTAMYAVNNWFGIRSGVQWQLRKYTDNSLWFQRNLSITNKHCFFTFPVYASFTIPFKRFSTYLLVGPYVGFSLDSSLPKNEKNNFEYGVSGGVGVKYKICSKIAIKAEATVHQSLNDNHETGSEYFKQPSYYTIPSVSFGLSYSIK